MGNAGPDTDCGVTHQVVPLVEISEFPILETVVIVPDIQFSTDNQIAKGGITQDKKAVSTPAAERIIESWICLSSRISDSADAAPRDCWSTGAHVCFVDPEVLRPVAGITGQIYHSRCHIIIDQGVYGARLQAGSSVTTRAVKDYPSVDAVDCYGVCITITPGRNPGGVDLCETECQHGMAMIAAHENRTDSGMVRGNVAHPS